MEQKARSLKFKHSEFRAVTEPDGVRRIRGYPILFNEPGYPYFGSEWTEVIEAGALDGVDLSNLFLLVEHNRSMALAKNGINLRAEVDNIGLFIEATLGNTYLDDYAFDRVSSGILDGMSFVFLADDVQTDSTNKQDRILHFTDVLEVSIVIFPAYEATVAVATETQNGTEERDKETPPGEDVEAQTAEARARADAALDLALALSR